MNIEKMEADYGGRAPHLKGTKCAKGIMHVFQTAHTWTSYVLQVEKALVVRSLC